MAGKARALPSRAIWRVPLGAEMLVTFVFAHSRLSSCLCGCFGWYDDDSVTAGSRLRRKLWAPDLTIADFPFS